MLLNEFLIKNSINLPNKILFLCNQAIEIMFKSVDPVHDQNHVFRILDDLDILLKQEKPDRKSIRLDILLLSICWHDVWRSQRFPKNILRITFEIFWDGLGSMLLFSKYAKSVKLDKHIAKEVKYAIRKHSTIQLMPRKTVEALIVKDLDLLEEWSLKRIKSLEKIFLDSGRMDPKPLRLAKFYFYHFLFPTKESKFYFNWSKKEFKKRRVDFIKEIERLLLKYPDFLSDHGESQTKLIDSIKIYS